MLTLATQTRQFHPGRPPVIVGRAFLRAGQAVAAVPADWSDDLARRVAHVLSTARPDELHEACFDGPAFDIELYASVLALANLLH